MKEKKETERRDVHFRSCFDQTDYTTLDAVAVIHLQDPPRGESAAVICRDLIPGLHGLTVCCLSSQRTAQLLGI